MGDFVKEIVCIIASHDGLVYFVDTMILSSVLICFLLVIRPWMKRLPRIGMYLLWIALGLRLLCPINVFVFMPEEIHQQMYYMTDQMSTRQMAVQIYEEDLEGLGGRDNGYQLSRSDLTSAVEKQKEEGFEGLLTHTSQSVLDRQITIRAVAEKSVEVVGVIWILGIVILIGHMLKSLFWVRFRLRDARLVDEGVYSHPLVNSAFVVGWHKPRIYLSERIAESDRRYILCHERVHIRRLDYVIKPLFFLLCVFYWMNPLMWVAYRCMVEDMEVSCDEAVLRKYGEHERKHYSYLLLSASMAHSGLRYALAGFFSGEIGKRIRHILNYRQPSAVLCVILAVITCCLGSGILSVPGALAYGLEGNNGKPVYVEQSYHYPEEEGLMNETKPLESVKGELVVEDGKLYTYLMMRGQVCGVAQRSGSKWLRVEDESLVQSQMDRKGQSKVLQQRGLTFAGAGMGFYVMYDFTKSYPELVVFNDETDKEEYRLDVEAYFPAIETENCQTKFCAGVTGDRIYFVSDEGIFEAVYGEWVIQKVVSPETDNVYYLSDDQSEYCDIVRGSKDDYYVAVRQGVENRICHYSVRKARIRG